MKRKTLTKPIVMSTILILLAGSIGLVSVLNAFKQAKFHDNIKKRISEIPLGTLEDLKERYKEYTILYNVAGQSSIFGIVQADTLYEKFEIDKWILEGSASTTGQLRILAPEFGWNPDRSKIEDGGWVLDGWVGSSISLSNPRVDPSVGGRMVLEVIDRTNEGVVLILGQPVMDFD